MKPQEIRRLDKAPSHVEVLEQFAVAGPDAIFFPLFIARDG